MIPTNYQLEDLSFYDTNVDSYIENDPLHFFDLSYIPHSWPVYPIDFPPIQDPLPLDGYYNENMQSPNPINNQQPNNPSILGSIHKTQSLAPNIIQITHNYYNNSNDYDAPIENNNNSLDLYPPPIVLIPTAKPSPEKSSVKIIKPKQKAIKKEKYSKDSLKTESKKIDTIYKKCKQLASRSKFCAKYWPKDIDLDTLILMQSLSIKKEDNNFTESLNNAIRREKNRLSARKGRKLKKEALNKLKETVSSQQKKLDQTLAKLNSQTRHTQQLQQTIFSQDKELDQNQVIIAQLQEKIKKQANAILQLKNENSYLRLAFGTDPLKDLYG